LRQEALNTVFKLAKSNPKIVFIGSDLGVNTLRDMQDSLPSQFFMEGISEQHIIGFASGLAKVGYIPYINTIGNFFSRRALEQIILDIALHQLPVKLLASGGGMVYAPLGPTHTATDDFAHLLAIPKFNVFAPADANEMREVVQLVANDGLPCYIRFGKGGETEVPGLVKSSYKHPFKVFGPSSYTHIVLTTGVSLQIALEAQKQLLNKGVNIAVIHFTKLNLTAFEGLYELLSNVERICVVEEHQERGGLMTQVLHYLLKYEVRTNKIRHISLGSEFIRKYGSQLDHLKNFGISPENIISQLID
jgi:transketolase